jgi:hypothetical protein
MGHSELWAMCQVRDSWHVLQISGMFVFIPIFAPLKFKQNPLLGGDIYPDTGGGIAQISLITGKR